MTNEQFVFWLQGRLEGRDAESIGVEEIRMIQEKLSQVLAPAVALDPWRRREPLVYRDDHGTDPSPGRFVYPGTVTTASQLRVTLANDA